jgi:hypothetical protein
MNVAPQMPDLASALEHAPIPLEYSQPCEQRKGGLHEGDDIEFVIVPTEFGAMTAYIQTIAIDTDASIRFRNFKRKESEAVSSGDPLNYVLGIRQYEWEEAGRLIFLRTRPTASYLNTAMQRMYEPLNCAPPITFVTRNQDTNGYITGKEFIEFLAEGKVFIASPNSGLTEAYAHDTDAHYWCRVHPKLCNLIITKAQQHVKRGIRTNKAGKLANPKDQQFADAVDTLTNLKSNPSSPERSRASVFIDKLILLEDPQDSFLLSAARSVMLYRGLLRHQNWLEERAASLKSKALLQRLPL